MKQLIRNLKAAFAVLMALSILLGVGLVYQQYQSQTSLLAVAGENKASLRERYAKAGKILTSDGIPLAYSKDGERHYADDELLQLSAVHLVGDYSHHMTNTIETLYQDELLGSRRGLGEQLLMDLSGRGMQGSNINLTINSNLNRAAYEYIKDYSGTAVLLNYKTGEILAMVSSPSTEMSNIIAYKNIPDSGLFNRALQSKYSPASCFKIFVTGAWLKSPHFDPTFALNCDGRPMRPNGARDQGHGHVDLDLAFTKSCNVYFGELAVKIGAKDMSDFLASTGLGTLDHVDRLKKQPLSWNNEAAEHDAALLSWFGTGQPVGELQLSFTPVDLALTAAAVVNGGNLLEPHVVKSITNPLNQVKNKVQPKVLQRMFEPEAANRLEVMMLEAVASDHSIQKEARLKSYEVGGKSGTLQVAKPDGSETTNALWTGFVKSDEHPYAVAVIMEDVRSTQKTAILTGGKILEAAVKHAGGQ